MNSLSTPTKTKMKPSNYNARSFIGVRLLSALSAIVVGGILAYFTVALKNDGYKVPWTFLIGLITCLITLVCLAFTTCINCCTRLSPIFNLLLNVPLLILWIVTVGLLGWNIMGTLSHSCSTQNWGNGDGISVCHGFKTLFAFSIFGALSQIAAIVVDARARITQTRSGRYAKMGDSTTELKLEPYDNTHLKSQTTSTSAPVLGYNDSTSQFRDTTDQYRDQDEHQGWRPGQQTHTVASSRYNDYGDIAGNDGQQQVRMNQFYGQHDNYYQTQGHGTGYDAGHSQQSYGYRY